MARIGLGRHQPERAAGDPLDGLVNLFDIGIVLAVAFLIAGYGAALKAGARKPAARRSGIEERAITPSDGAPRLRGRGNPVGTVYRLPNGSLILVGPAVGGSSQSTNIHTRR